MEREPHANTQKGSSAIDGELALRDRVGGSPARPQGGRLTKSVPGRWLRKAIICSSGSAGCDTMRSLVIPCANESTGGERDALVFVNMATDRMGRGDAPRPGAVSEGGCHSWLYSQARVCSKPGFSPVCRRPTAHRSRAAVVWNGNGRLPRAGQRHCASRRRPRTKGRSPAVAWTGRCRCFHRGRSL